MSQVILVGATGFLGQNLQVALQEAGHDILAVSRAGEPPAGGGVGLTLTELETYPKLARDAVLVNVAARRYDARTFAQEQDVILAENWALVQQVYALCARRGIHEVRQASSVAVYPAAELLLDDSRPIDLNASPHPGEAFYGWSKRWGEILADLYAARHGVSTVSFRITNPYGPFDTTDIGAAHVATAFVLRALEPGETFGLRGGTVERDFVYAPDVADAFLATLSWRGRTDAYNLGSGRNTSLAELAETVVAASGSGKRIVALDAPASGPASRRISARRLHEEVKSDWTSLEDGVARTIAWYRHVLER